MNKEQRIQRELDRLRLQAWQNFKINGSSFYESIMHRINSYGAVLFDNSSGETKISGQSILTLEPEDITWREFIQPDWSEDLLGWCKGLKDCWIAKDGDATIDIYIYENKPIYEDVDYWESSTGRCPSILATFIKNSLLVELNQCLKKGKDGTVIQVIDSKPHLRQVIDGVIQED